MDDRLDIATTIVTSDEVSTVCAVVSISDQEAGSADKPVNEIEFDADETAFVTVFTVAVPPPVDMLFIADTNSVGKDKSALVPPLVLIASAMDVNSVSVTK